VYLVASTLIKGALYILEIYLKISVLPEPDLPETSIFDGLIAFLRSLSSTYLIRYLFLIANDIVFFASYYEII